MEPYSQIVIGSDGTVLAASGEFGPGLVDVRLEDCDALSHEIREAGKALLQELTRSGNRVTSQTVALDGPDHALHLVAIEALPIRRTATDIRDLLASKLAVMSFQARGDDVTVSIEVANDVPPVVQLDSEKVAWAVTTLVGNALRYVRSASRRLNSQTVAVTTGYDPAKSEITIDVQDDGPGIPADTVNRLFKRDGLNVRGAGLALLLIRDITAAHGGRVEVRSNTAPVAHGTTIRLTLPAR
jgi:NtrC-family two-component system sensor histidine kinase KinB